MSARTKKALLVTLVCVFVAVLFFGALPLLARHLGDTKEGVVAVPRNVESALETENLTFGFVASTDKFFTIFYKETKNSPGYIQIYSSAEFVLWFKAGNGTELSKAYIRTGIGHYFVYWAPLFNGLANVVYYEKIDFSPYPFLFAEVNLKETPSAVDTQILVSYTQKEFFWIFAMFGGVMIVLLGLVIFLNFNRRAYTRAQRAARRSDAQHP